MTIGEIIRDLRVRRKVSQLELCSQVGISQSYLSLIEQGEREPDLAIIKRIANALKIPQQLIFLLSCDKGSRQDEYVKPLRNIALAINDILEAI